MPETDCVRIEDLKAKMQFIAQKDGSVIGVVTMKDINELPPAEPIREKASWQAYRPGKFSIYAVCPKCGYEPKELFNFCPDCGTDMRP